MRVLGARLTVLGVAGAALVLAGCSSRGPRALPTLASLPMQDKQAVGSAQYPLADGGEVEIYHQGYGVRKVKGVAVPTLRIQLSVTNTAAEPLVLRAADSKLVDNHGDSLIFSDLRRDGQPAETMLEIEPGAHAQVDLFYDLPPSYAMEKVENFRFYWGYEAGERAISEETLFLRTDPGNMYWQDGRGKKRPYRYFMAVKA